MTPSDEHAIGQAILAAGLAGRGEGELLALLSEGCARAGVALDRALLIVDTLHPIYEGRVFRWRGDGTEPEPEATYGRTDQGEMAESWRRSLFYAMLQNGDERYRCRLNPDEETGYSHLRDYAREGATDYVAVIQRFEDEAIGDLDCIYCNFVSHSPDGFADRDVESLARLVPLMALAVKSASLARIASTLVEVYLGRDARRRVLNGRIERGVAETIETVLWFSDLRGFTTITDTASPGEIIPLLNDYSGAVIEAVHAAGGDVLKLIGDGVLAIFNFPDAGAAASAALTAEADLRRRAAEIGERRRAEGRPTTSVYIGLHLGEVFYGHIGSADRLDFTVVGPSVNEVSRIASMCRSVDRLVVASTEFRDALPGVERDQLVSLGRYALRGVGRARELFTLDPALL